MAAPDIAIVLKGVDVGDRLWVEYTESASNPPHRARSFRGRVQWMEYREGEPWWVSFEGVHVGLYREDPAHKVSSSHEWSFDHRVRSSLLSHDDKGAPCAAQTEGG
jgi:hypothetical protein